MEDFQKQLQDIIDATPDEQTAAIRELRDELKNSLQSSNDSVLQALDSLREAIMGIEMPDGSDKVTAGLSELLDAIKAVKLDPKIEVQQPSITLPDFPEIPAPIVKVPKAAAPVVNVPAPVVNIPELDLSPVLEAAQATTSAIENLRFPTPSFPRMDPLARFKPCDKDDAADPSYYGFADSSGDFYIMQINDALGTFRYYYGGKVGTHDYATSWAGRAGLTYDYIYSCGLI